MLGGPENKQPSNTMPIILDYPFSIKRYIATIETKELEVPCECCGKLTRKHGKYKRTVHFKKRTYEIPIMRRKCRDCKKTFSLIPSFIISWGRFANHIIEFFLRWIFSGMPLTLLAERLSTENVSVISLKTLYRWKSKFFGQLMKWWIFQRNKMAEYYQEGDGLLALYREGIDSSGEFLILLTFFFRDHQAIPRAGKLLSAIISRQSVN